MSINPILDCEIASLIIKDKTLQDEEMFLFPFIQHFRVLSLMIVYLNLVIYFLILLIYDSLNKRLHMIKWRKNVQYNIVDLKHGKVIIKRLRTGNTPLNKRPPSCSLSLT